MSKTSKIGTTYQTQRLLKLLLEDAEFLVHNVNSIRILYKGYGIKQMSE